MSLTKTTLQIYYLLFLPLIKTVSYKLRLNPFPWH